MTERETYDPTREWTDDRNKQETLVDESNRAAADTDSRIDEGGSNEFADDRATYDPTEDVSEQASLTAETVDDGGQMDLTGDQATEEPEWIDDEDDSNDGPTIHAPGDGRRKTLDAIEQKGRLDSVQSFNSIEDMTDAVREIRLGREGWEYMSPPTEVISQLESAYNDLPEEAQSHFLNDDTLHRRINAARNQFNDWMGRKQREQKMPSPMEAGRSNYPAEKAREKSRLAREANEDLKERLDKIRAGATGAKQRALEAVGSSVAEHNQQKAEQKAQSMKEKLEPGDVVLHFTTSGNWQPWGVKRLNDKSVRLKRPHSRAGAEKPMSDETYPEYDHATVDYDSRWLKHIPKEDVPKLSEHFEDIPDGNTGEFESFDSREAAVRHLLGDDWVDDNLDFDEPPEQEDQGSDEEQDEETPELEEIRFGTLDAANDWREDNGEYLHPEDNRASKTVAIAGDAPESVLDDAGVAATASQPQSKRYGQAELTDDERRQLENRDGWSWGSHGFHAMSAKAVLLEEGGTPWMDYYDMDLEPAEHASVVDRAEDMAVREGTTGPGEMNLDTEKSEAEIASAVDQGQGEQCSHAADHAEEGDTDAAEFLLSECDWTEEEVEQLVETAEAMGEDPARLYDPTGDFEAGSDDGMEFGEWAREYAPASSSEPERPSDEELAEIAPAPEVDKLRPEAYRALQKAWTGYQIARSDAREAHDEAEKYAQVINGVRAVNGQDPLDFEEIEEWSGGEVMPDDPSEKFPGPAQERTIREASTEGLFSRTEQQTLSLYDPTGEE